MAIATETGALFGRVEDEWSLEQIWSDLPDPYLYRTPPPLGSWPDWLSWFTYFAVDVLRFAQLHSAMNGALMDLRSTKAPFMARNWARARAGPDR